MRISRRNLLGSGVFSMVLPSSAFASPPDMRDVMDLRERAVKLHDRVRDQIRFGWTSNFANETPEETDAARTGFCITKGALLVRDLRANGIPARLIFAEIDARVLSGLIDPGTPWLDHAFVEADLADGTLAFDSHVVDAPLFTAARARLIQEGLTFGYGVHAEGTTAFGGYSQFVPGVVRGEIWGPFETVAEFQSRAPRVWNRLPWIGRLAFGFFADAANARADELRGSS